MREILEQNETVILFLNGLVFFALGFALWLQRRRATRLRLTSSLVWLAAFAFVEAFAVWGFVFVPIQEQTLEPEAVTLLIVVRGVIQMLAMLFLLQFGLRLFELTRQAFLGITAVSVVWFFVVIFGMVALGDPRGWTVEQWESSAVALFRYTVLIPAALLGAVGLWRQRESLGLAGLGGIRPYTAAAAGVLLALAVFGGLVVPDAPWAPGGLFNESNWLESVGMQINVARVFVGLALAILAIKLLEIFEVEAALQLEALNRARLVAEERARFGRDLHDGTIQSIYAAGLQLEAASMTLDESPTRDEIGRVVSGLNNVIDGIRAYIRGLGETDDTPLGIAATLTEVCLQHERDTGRQVRFRALGVDAAGPLPVEASQNLGQILREALSNSTRHGGNCKSTVYLSFRPDEMELQVRDNGAGMDVEAAERAGGFGLRNMKERARRLGGRLNIYSEIGNGSRLIVSIPLDSDVLDDEQPAADTQEKVTA